MKKYCFGVDVGGTTVKIGLFDVEGNIKEVFATELNYVEFQRLFQDFNYLMEDDSCCHFEFARVTSRTSVLARSLGDQRDSGRNSQSVFRLVYASDEPNDCSVQ